MQSVKEQGTASVIVWTCNKRSTSQGIKIIKIWGESMVFPQLLVQEIVPPPPPDKDEEERIIYITVLCQFISQLNLFYFSPITVWEDSSTKTPGCVKWHLKQVLFFRIIKPNLPLSWLGPLTLLSSSPVQMMAEPCTEALRDFICSS